MKTPFSKWSMPGCLVALFFCGSVSTHGATLFTDNFDPGASPLWGNESGAWQASSGLYYATVPNNLPNAYSSLPFDVVDFSVDFDINGASDGGIFLHATPVPGSPNGIKGVLLNLKVPNGGPRVYWHVFYDGTNATPALNLVNVDFGTSPHVHVEVIGDIYSVYINGSASPITTFTNETFSSGRIALYDFSSQSFANVTLSIPDPQLLIRMDQDAATLSWPTNFPKYILETSADLTQPQSWSSFGGPYLIQNGFFEVRLPTLNLLQKQFFRLSAPRP